MYNTSRHPQLDGIVKLYKEILEKYLRKVISTHQRDWDKSLPLLLLDYGESTHINICTMPTRIVLGRDLHLPCNLLFGVPKTSINL
jgi:hypothetical protein